MKLEETAFFVSALSNIPYLNMLLSGLQLSKTFVQFAHVSRSNWLTVLQSKYLGKHFMGLRSFLQNFFQHDAYRSIDSKYHAAPKTCKQQKNVISLQIKGGGLEKEKTTQSTYMAGQHV